MAILSTRPAFASAAFQFIVDVDFELDAFSAYLDLTEGVMESAVRNKIEENDLIFERAALAVRDPGEEIDVADDIIMRNLLAVRYESLFIALFGFFEKKMFLFATAVEEELNDPSRTLEAIQKDRGIHKCRKFLEQNAGIDFALMNEEWKEITVMQKMRNRFIHNHGRIEDCSKNASEILNLDQIPGVEKTIVGNMIGYSINHRVPIDHYAPVIRRMLMKVHYRPI